LFDLVHILSNIEKEHNIILSNKQNTSWWSNVKTNCLTNDAWSCFMLWFL